ncbi:MAG: DOMON-like domain-containing protein [Bdellovibrionota bacterium]
MRTTSLHLRPFDDRPGSTLELRAGAVHLGDLVEFEFLLSGSATDLSRVVWPETKSPAERGRRDELWKATCLELFLGDAHSTSYLEMNVSPTGDWNLYAFDDYRKGMRCTSGEVALHASPKSGEPYFRLVGAIRTQDAEKSGELVRLLGSRELVFGATAVLEYQTGEREYWALSHAGEKPDFHLRASFTARLSRPGFK